MRRVLAVSFVLLVAPALHAERRRAIVVTPFPPCSVIEGTPEGARAYIWSDNRQLLLRYENSEVITLKAPGAIVGIAADPNDGLHVRVGTSDGSIAESFDGGATWRGIGFPPASQAIFYRVAFDQNDVDHVLSGASVAGAFVSRDGGKNWTRATGFASQSVNAFNFAISPVDGNVVWLAAIDLKAGESPRHIYMSRDGGQSYVAVVEQSADVTIVNQPVMAANPANRDVMYFVFGTFFQGYGTDIYRYDASTKTVSKTHNGYHDVNSIAFYPGRADIMYFGLEVEQVR